MAKRANNEDFSFEIDEIIGTLKESSKHDWAKAILKISWGDRPATLDIRNFDFKNSKPGKGISLTDEEVDGLVNMLLERDYGSLESLKQAIERKKSRLFDTSDMKKAMFESKEELYSIECEIR